LNNKKAVNMKFTAKTQAFIFARSYSNKYGNLVSAESVTTALLLFCFAAIRATLGLIN